MKISIIGAGNMGSAIARGLALSGEREITVSNRTEAKLAALKAAFPHIAVTTDNAEAASRGDIVIIAVKPWVAEAVMAGIAPALGAGKQVVSIAAGVTTGRMAAFFPDTVALHYVIPNTAISIGKSMTFMASARAGASQTEAVRAVFAKLGAVMAVAEKDIPACMALASCGIAYAMRYVRANVEGAVELGLRPADATAIMAQTMIGAAGLLAVPGSHPEAEIDKVTTPGGLTIRGLNALEGHGFTAAVVKALKASV